MPFPVYRSSDKRSEYQGTTRHWQSMDIDEQANTGTTVDDLQELTSKSAPGSQRECHVHFVLGSEQAVRYHWLWHE